MKKRYFLFIAFLISTLVSFAQTDEGPVKIDFSGNTDIYHAVIHDGVHYAIEGATVTFTLTFDPQLDDDQKDAKVQIVECTFNGETKTCDWNDEDKKCTITFEDLSQLEEKKATFTINNNQKLTFDSDPITVLSAPSWEGSYDKLYLKTDRTIVVDMYEGGNTEGWKFQLGDEDETTNSVLTISKPGTSLPKTDTTKLVVINYAPDGNTVWFTSDEKKIETYFYDTPSAKFDSSSSEQEKNFYKNTGNSEWKVKLTGGNPSGWEIEWTGGATSGKGETYKPFTENVTNDSPNKTIHVELINKADDGHELYQIGFDVATINVYKEMSHMPASQNISVYAGEEVTFKVTDVDGGYPGGWQYSWTNSGSEAPSMTANPIETTTYTLTAKNIYNGKEWDSFTEDFTATVYSKPSAESVETVTAYKDDGTFESSQLKGATVDYEITTVTADTYELVVDDEVNMSITPQGGVEKGQGEWSYTVYEDGKPLQNNIFHPTEPRDYKITIEVNNGQDVVVKPYHATIPRTYKVYPKPKFVGKSYTTINLYSGDSEALPVNNSLGGHEDERPEFGWNRYWEGGNKPSEGNMVSASADNQDQVFTYHEEYWCSGVKRFDKKQEFTVKTWGEPQATLTEKLAYLPTNSTKREETTIDKTLVDQSYTDHPKDYHLVEGDTIYIEIFKQGGVNDAWKYTVTENGKQIQGENGKYSFLPYGKTHTVEVVVNNDGEKFKKTYTRTYVVHDIPTFDKNEVPDTVNAYAGFTGQYTVSGISQDTQGWTYYLDEKQIVSKSISFPSFDNITTKSLVPHTFRAVYELEGKERLNKTKTVNFVAWPKPEVNLRIKLCKKDRNDKDITYYDSKESGKDKFDKVEMLDTINCFENDTLDICYTIQGGYTNEAKNTWQYFNSSTPYNIKYQETDNCVYGCVNDSLILNEDIEANQEFPNSLHIKNVFHESSPNNQWLGDTLDQEFKMPLHVWKNGTITPNLTDSIEISSEYLTKSWERKDTVDVYEGSDLKFRIDHEYGYTGNTENGGWKYTWKEHGDVVSTNDKGYTFTATIEDGTKPYEDKDYTVEIFNHIGDNYSRKDTLTYYARIWRKAVIAENFTMEDVGNDRREEMSDNSLYVRSGNKVNITLAPTKGGYQGSYVYNWTGSDEQIDDKDNGIWEWIAPKVSDSRMGVSESTIKLNNRVVGPYGRVWDGTPEVTKTIKVYNRPSTPTGLKIKGNGTSGTMICTTEISDEDLVDREYYLVFGYVDSDHKRHDMASKRQEGTGLVRWSDRFSIPLSNIAPDKLYVYALWKYTEDDGTVSEVTSGYRLAASERDPLEDWDSSLYHIPSATTRAGGNYVNGIEDVTSNSGVKMASVYSADGIKTSHLNNGINIVRMSDGSIRKVWKNK